MPSTDQGCYLCGGVFAAADIARHRIQCYQRTLYEWEQADENFRGPKPLHPRSVGAPQRKAQRQKAAHARSTPCLTCNELVPNAKWESHQRTCSLLCTGNERLCGPPDGYGFPRMVRSTSQPIVVAAPPAHMCSLPMDTLVPGSMLSTAAQAGTVSYCPPVCQHGVPSHGHEPLPVRTPHVCRHGMPGDIVFMRHQCPHAVYSAARPWWSDDRLEDGGWQGREGVEEMPRRSRRPSTSQSPRKAQSAGSQEEREVAWRPPDYPFFRRSDPRYIDYLHEMQTDPATKRCFDARLHKACRSHSPTPARGRSPHRCSSCQPIHGKSPHSVQFAAKPEQASGNQREEEGGSMPQVRPTVVEEDRCTIS
eukprot:GGOE01036698.1.p1 GENE.GGOE01036698.1~~GGOE01036698.1.p1  ORF type:complete len:364 (+),score=23.36 GGOE01036698.1:51-1142(+)